jgi:competence protein ComEC
LFAHHYLSRELPAALEGSDVVAVCTVDNLPYRFEQGAQFNFAVEHAADLEGRPVSLPPRLALSWYAEAGFEDVQPGER